MVIVISMVCFVVLVNIPRLVNGSPSSLSESDASLPLCTHIPLPFLSAQASQTVWVSIRIFIIHDSYIIIYPL